MGPGLIQRLGGEVRREYKQPPISEAVCEIQFEPSKIWDFFSPSRLFDLLREEYDGEPRQVSMSGVKMVPAAEFIPEALSITQDDAKTELANADRTRSVRFDAR